jgi:hypothetical protein
MRVGYHPDEAGERFTARRERRGRRWTGRGRVIVLPDEAVSILRGLIANRPEGLLFPAPGRQADHGMERQEPDERDL